MSHINNRLFSAQNVFRTRYVFRTEFIFCSREEDPKNLFRLLQSIHSLKFNWTYGRALDRWSRLMTRALDTSSDKWQNNAKYVHTCIIHTYIKLCTGTCLWAAGRRCTANTVTHHRSTPSMHMHLRSETLNRTPPVNYGQEPAGWALCVCMGPPLVTLLVFCTLSFLLMKYLLLITINIISNSTCSAFMWHLKDSTASIWSHTYIT